MKISIGASLNFGGKGEKAKTTPGGKMPWEIDHQASIIYYSDQSIHSKIIIEIKQTYNSMEKRLRQALASSI